MCKVIGTSRIAPSDRALLEMSLEYVAPRKGVLAKMTHVWAVSGICVRC